MVYGGCVLARSRLIFVCADLAVLDGAWALLSQRHLQGWRGSVLSLQVAALQRRGLPLCPFHQRHPVLSVVARWGFWGLLVGVALAMGLVGLLGLSEGLGRATTAWSLPVCLASFGAWLGGMRGLTLDSPEIAAYLPEVQAGRHVVLLDVKDVDQRLVKKVMAMAGARKLAERPLGLSWARLFPPPENPRG